MDHPNVETARASLEPLMTGDVETMAAGIAEDATWHILRSNQRAGGYSRREAIVGRFGRRERGYAFTLDEIRHVMGGDGHVVALVRVTAKSPSDSASTNRVWVMHVRDGKATEFWGSNDDQAAVDRVMMG